MGLYRDNGKENGNFYYLGFRVLGFIVTLKCYNLPKIHIPST